MQITKRKDANVVEDGCGQVEELYNSDNLSVSIATITDSSEPHRHEKTEEVYHVIKGSGVMVIGEERSEIEEGDTITIPKGHMHHVEVGEGGTMEVFVVTHPRFDPEDMIS